MHFHFGLLKKTFLTQKLSLFFFIVQLLHVNLKIEDFFGQQLTFFSGPKKIESNNWEKDCLNKIIPLSKLQVTVNSFLTFTFNCGRINFVPAKPSSNPSQENIQLAAVYKIWQQAIRICTCALWVSLLWHFVFGSMFLYRGKIVTFKNWVNWCKLKKYCFKWLLNHNVKSHFKYVGWLVRFM